ncbi:hypothetical protein [Haladaptatus cibarius]|uniref:hypothetical protein n=1 Tax=Haladaptatus cibarius TaxID=453847 RepID=UPI00067906B0|nr:hypothetical protein [Haladaptatus cibarius]
MDVQVPESRIKQVGIGVGAAVGVVALLLVVLPLALLAVEILAGIVVTIVSTVTEPRRGRRPA